MRASEAPAFVNGRLPATVGPGQVIASGSTGVSVTGLNAGSRLAVVMYGLRPQAPGLNLDPGAAEIT